MKTLVLFEVLTIVIPFNFKHYNLFSKFEGN